jgi:hypothetical protein
MTVENTRAAIIGGSESGKSFRAMGYSRGYWRRYGLRSVVFDPWARSKKPLVWGRQAIVFDDFDTWKRAITGVQSCVAIWDEASGNGGRDRENVSLLTEIRHRHPVLICIAHAHAALLPMMRINLTDLFIAQADPDDAAEWAKTMKDPAVRGATQLGQYEFLHKRNFKPVRVLRESAAEIEAGILP